MGGVKLSYAVDKISNQYPHLSESDIYSRLRYSTFVNFNRRYLYFEVPKAACTTIKSILHKVERLPPITPFVGPLSEVSRELFIHDRDQFELPSLVDFDDKKQREILELDDVFRFTVVRNPYGRLQSGWRDKVLTCQPLVRNLYLRLKGSLPTPRQASSFISFAEFLEFISTESPDDWDPHWRIQADHLFLKALNFSHIGKVEEIEKTVELFCNKTGFSSAPSDGIRNESLGIMRYDETLAARTWDLYERDFDAFGYTRESWIQFAQDGVSQAGLEANILSRSVLDIAERNIVIGTLYEQRDALAAELRLIRNQVASVE